MTAKLSTVALRTIAGWIVLCVGLSQLGVVDSFTANYLHEMLSGGRLRAKVLQ
jgi:hypothetical protein